MTMSTKQEKAVTTETAMTQSLFLCRTMANNNILRHCMMATPDIRLEIVSDGCIMFQLKCLKSKNDNVSHLSDT